MQIDRRLLWLLVAIPLGWYVGGQGARAWQAVQSASLCSLTFVSFGEFPPDLLLDSARRVEETFGVRVRIERPIPIAEQTINYGRQQLVGERLIAQMKEALPALAQDPSAMLVSFTTGDMYLEHKNWQFAFAGREAGRFAVISTARMDPQSFGLAKDETVLRGRLRKMVLKQVGLYFYGLPERKEKTSVLYSPILGVDDLDEVSSDLDAVDRVRLPEQKPCK
jgi:predicted Zn-dependent protease